ncbi:hypothetical protein C8R44DRAFT_865972 [Mycena epipterygia]|nr:hypothetical protein C8R44DRAFT_865972 [Mycena epipterygia]
MPVTLPRLPEDLERKILEIVAFEDHASIPTLLPVAKRTLSWLEPVLYRVLVLLDDPRTISRVRDLIARKQDSLWRDGPRHLFMAIKSSPDDANALLSKCSNVEDLVVYCDRTQPRRFLPHLQVMPLRRLSIDMADMFGSRAAMDLRSAAFTGLTYLLLMDDLLQDVPEEDQDVFRPDDEVPEDHWITKIAHLPCLTHLAFVEEVPREMLDTVLKRSSTLQVLVNLRLDLRRMPVQSLHRRLRIEDERFVIMPFVTWAEDWEAGARTGKDFWASADEFIAAKRRKEIDAGTYWTDDDMMV